MDRFGQRSNLGLKDQQKPDVEITTEETSFLEIVESWHTLRHQCDIM